MTYGASPAGARRGVRLDSPAVILKPRCPCGCSGFCSSLTRQEDTMRSPWRALAFGVVVALGVVLGADIVSLSAQASDPRVGTWKLNVTKSKVSPGPPPKALTVKVEPSGQGEKVTTEGVNAEGGNTATQYTANFDGKDSPLTGSPNADTVSLKRIDVRTTERT